MTYANHTDKALGFRIHAIVFVPTIALLFVINLLTGGPLWALWSLLGWGVGLLAHWWFALGPGRCKAA
jgi:hypothetical protein